MLRKQVNKKNKCYVVQSSELHVLWQWYKSRKTQSNWTSSSAPSKLLPANSILWRDALEPKLYEKNHAKTHHVSGSMFKKQYIQRPNCLFLLKNMAPNTPLTTHLFGLLRGRTSWCSGRCRTCRPKRLLETRWCCSHKRSGAKSGHESSRKIPTIHTFLPRICLNRLKLLFVSGCFAVSPSNLTIWSNLIKVPFSKKTRMIWMI